MHEAIGAIIHNDATRLWHPIYFRPDFARWDGEAEIEYVSTLLHMPGFTEVHECLKEVNQTCRLNGWLPVNKKFTWDGSGLPDIRQNQSELTQFDSLTVEQWSESMQPSLVQGSP